MFAKRTDWDLALNPLAKALAERRAEGKPLIDLTVSNPTDCGFTYDMQAILAALESPAAMKYEPNPKGLEVARRAVATYYADRAEDVSTEDIFLTTSTSEGYSWLMRLLCDAGDEVLIPSPGYPLFDFLAELNDVKLVRYPLFYDHGWHFDFHALEQAITPRTRAVIVVHPNNPTGNYVKPKEREELKAICAKRGLAIIADEVFLDFALDGRPRASFVTNGRTTNVPLTFVLSGISKICGLPQMKVAWLVVNGADREKDGAIGRLEVIADTYLSLNAPVQYALGALLATRHSFQRQVLERISTNVAELDKQLAEVPSWLRFGMEGGWSTVLQGPTAAAGADRALNDLLDRGVLLHPGAFYGLSGRGIVVSSLLTKQEDHRPAIGRLLGTRYTVI